MDFPETYIKNALEKYLPKGIRPALMQDIYKVVNDNDRIFIR